MSVETDAKHIVDFTLQPVGGWPNRDCTGHTLTVRDHGLHSNTLVTRERIENPDHVELLLALRIVDRRYVHAVIKLFLVAKNLQQLARDGGFGDHVALAEVRISFTNPRTIMRFELRDHG